MAVSVCEWIRSSESVTEIEFLGIQNEEVNIFYGGKLK